MKKNKIIFSLLCCLLLFSTLLKAQLLVTDKISGSFDITKASIYVDVNDDAVIKKAATLLQQDIQLISGKKILITNDISKEFKSVIIIGSIQKSFAIQQLIKQRKLIENAVKDKWEAYQISTIKNPTKNIEQALVIMGSDRRGTAFGVFELSRQIGVSPWYWWADVPAIKKENIFINTNTIINDAPKVKYRGIFINDEAPALTNWSKEKFGGYNHLFYTKVFELMLRLKSNYIWPAMWGSAFYDDDSLNIKTADEYAIVIGTSHHEPLMRAHDEWRRYGNKQKWNYDSTETGLKEFWKQGIVRATNEKIVSVGMRGDGDEPMSRETATTLLERIVTDQRKIIENVTGKPASQTPQLWALYKEVQDYYDKGMRVPDDVTLLLCDDNWGNIRKLPKLNDAARKGGYGIYYHFDYVGGPRNYKWLNTNPLPRIWEQMQLAWEYKAKEIWIVNVGDIKPMEFPISFFLDYAWNPEKIGADDLQKYTTQWSAAQFGNKHAAEIASIIATYSKYNGRKKPELLDENTYNIENGEAALVARNYNDLLLRAEKVNKDLSAEYRDAFYQLVLHPVKACANLQNMYTAVAFNKSLFKQKLFAANKYADDAKRFYINDSIITQEYHKIALGKWNHMMDQTHIGYTYWQQPTVNKMPEVKYLSADSATGSNKLISLDLPSTKDSVPYNVKGNVFFELNKYVSIDAEHFTKAIQTKNISWKILPDHGRSGNAITVWPVTATSVNPSLKSPHLTYKFYTYSKGNFNINAYFSPTLNFHNTAKGLQYAVSIDDEQPQIISINKDDRNVRIWESWMKDNIIIKTSAHQINKTGKHTLKYWMVDAAVVVQKFVLNFGETEKTFLGPEETKYTSK